VKFVVFAVFATGTGDYLGLHYWLGFGLVAIGLLVIRSGGRTALSGGGLHFVIGLVILSLGLVVAMVGAVVLTVPLQPGPLYKYTVVITGCLLWLLAVVYVGRLALVNRGRN
jgi:hypothetical protein